VHDHLSNGTEVGNTYTPVEFVHADGISMATYVATNVQNFPDPNTDQSDVLVVQADLSTQVSDGGSLLSAYGGVAASGALRDHRSAFGTGSGPTAAAPGSFDVGAGGLAYGVTLANAVVGIDLPPPPFSNISTQSNDVMKGDGEFAVLTSAGAVNPQWTWHFEQSPIVPRTWLATGVSLNPAAAPLPPPRATGGGRIDPSIGKTSFGFNVDGRSGPPFSGQMEVVYHGGASRMTRIKSLVIDGLSSSPDARGGVCVTWTGSARVNNSDQRRFTATVCDNGQPSSSSGRGPDRFGISVDGSVSTGLTDLTGGNSQVRQ
jgi:hypothetical protein